MADTPIPDKKPFNVRCGTCEHIWTIAELPMRVDAICKIMRLAICPVCGEQPRIFIKRDETAP